MCRYLCALCEYEVTTTTDQKVYLRGNSLMTATLDRYMKLTTIDYGSYLKNTLGELVGSVCEQELQCEVCTHLSTALCTQHAAMYVDRAYTLAPFNCRVHPLRCTHITCI